MIILKKKGNLGVEFRTDVVIDGQEGSNPFNESITIENL